MGGGWGEREQENVLFLSNVLAPWGQGATVIQSHRAAVQKPPAMYSQLDGDREYKQCTDLSWISTLNIIDTEGAIIF